MTDGDPEARRALDLASGTEVTIVSAEDPAVADVTIVSAEDPAVADVTIVSAEDVAVADCTAYRDSNPE